MSYSASALERFTYCPVSSWLSRQGVKGDGEAIREGSLKHAAKGRLLAVWEAMIRAYARHVDAATLFILVAAATALVAVDLTLVDPFGVAGIFLLFLSLLCLLGATGYLMRAVRARDRGE